MRYILMTVFVAKAAKSLKGLYVIHSFLDFREIQILSRAELAAS